MYKSAGISVWVCAHEVLKGIDYSVRGGTETTTPDTKELNSRNRFFSPVM